MQIGVKLVACVRVNDSMNDDCTQKWSRCSTGSDSLLSYLPFKVLSRRENLKKNDILYILNDYGCHKKHICEILIYSIYFVHKIWENKTCLHNLAEIFFRFVWPWKVVGSSPGWVKPKTLYIDIFCFSKHAALRSKRKN